MFSENDISDYYQHTRVHYNRFWKIKEGRSLNYGFWEKDTKDLTEAFQNINNAIIENAEIEQNATVLDAGCGVGGASTYIAKKVSCKVVGITLNEQQCSDAKQNAKLQGIENACSFYIMNYCKTTFNDQTFDVVYGLESICHATEKKDFLQEAYRLLKPGGRLLVIDYFKEENLNKAQTSFLHKWLHAWAIKDIDTVDSFCKKADEVGFKQVSKTLKTEKIRKSSWLIYFYSIIGTIPSLLYQLYNRRATHFGKNHTKAGIIQYKALKQNLWNYYVIKAVK